MALLGPGKTYDVAIVGAAVAGCIAALRYAERGISVLLLDKRKSPDDYKVLCTHFIQPVAFPILRRLGLDRKIEEAGGVRTKAAFCTQSGRIDSQGDSYAADEESIAYNIERRVLDPMLRRRAMAQPRVDWVYGARLVGLDAAGDLTRLDLIDAEGHARSAAARLIVSADGRNSTVARLLANEAASADNQRAAFFAYFVGAQPIAHDRSLFMLQDDEMGFIYPLSEGRTLISVYVKKDRGAQWRAGGNPAPLLVSFLRDFPGCPDLRRARAVSPVYGYADYPNLLRRPVCEGAAFVGDACFSLDPMSGVGCAFAAVSADMLVSHTASTLQQGAALAPSLEAYARACKETLESHAEGIKADSLIAKSAASVRKVYDNITGDEELARAFIALTGRIVSPKEFQRRYLAAVMDKAKAAAGQRVRLEPMR